MAQASRQADRPEISSTAEWPLSSDLTADLRRPFLAAPGRSVVEAYRASGCSRRRPPVVRRRRAAPKMPDFSQIMGHLSDAIAFIRVSERSLEQSLLRMGLAALDSVYTEIDLASIALSGHVPPRV